MRSPGVRFRWAKCTPDATFANLICLGDQCPCVYVVVCLRIYIYISVLHISICVTEHTLYSLSTHSLCMYVCVCLLHITKWNSLVISSTGGLPAVTVLRVCVFAGECCCQLINYITGMNFHSICYLSARYAMLWNFYISLQNSQHQSKLIIFQPTYIHILYIVLLIISSTVLYVCVRLIITLTYVYMYLINIYIFVWASK